MFDMKHSDVASVSGGNPYLVALGAVILIGNAADILYNAAGAFREGYAENDKV